METEPSEPAGDGQGGGDSSGEAPVRTQWQLFRRRFFHHKLAVFSLVFLVVLIVLCFSASWVAPHARDWTNDEIAAAPPSVGNWLGTDSGGHDILSNLLHGGQNSLKIGLAVALFSTLIGTAVGAIAGWYGKLVDATLMRITDLFLVIPQLAVLAIGLKYLTEKDKGASPTSMIIVLVAIFWMSIARVVRAQMLSLREKEFVEAAKASGASPVRIIVRHVLPNCLGPIMVAATLAVAYAVLTEAAAAFLGFGFTYPTTSWGTMISDSKTSMGNPDQWYNVVFPGMMLFLTVLAVNFIGDGLRDALDPTSTE
ncbi:MAG: ABC transporter permease [Acidimicrobiia bacterium]